MSRAAAAAARAANAANIRARKMASRIWGLVRGRKSDGNAKLLDQRFLVHGASLVLLDAVGDGVPDRLVGYRDLSVLVEYKNADGRGRVGEAQQVFAELWRGGRAFEAWTVEDVEAILREMRQLAARLHAALPAQTNAANTSTM